MIFRFGEFAIDDTTFEIRRGDAIVNVERRVFNLLLYLAQNRERVVTKDEIFEYVWQGRRVSSGSLKVAVTALRRALGDKADSPEIVQTVRGRGYRFIAPLAEEPTATAANERTAATRFVGRRSELRSLRKMLETARRGARQVCLVSGEAGIGKSRLCEEFCALSRESGAVAITARCMEEDGTPPFWPWIQILRSAIKLAGGIEMWPRATQNDIGRLIPEILGSTAIHPPSGNEPSTARFRLFDAVTQVVGAAAVSSGLVLFIDDIHRGDPASLLLLEFIATQLAESPLVLLMAQRDTAVQQHQGYREAMARIMRGTRSHLIELGGLTRAEVGELMRDIGTAPGVDSETLLDLTGGNPLFLSHVAPFVRRGTWDPRPLPGTVKDSISRQLDGLDAQAVFVLERAAVLGRSFFSRTLSHFCGDRCNVSEALLASQAARLVEEGPDGQSFRFRHALVRDILYERISSDERALLHWRAADSLEAVHGRESDAICPEVAFHRFCGVGQGVASIAIDSCRRAGKLASDRLAYEEAATQFRRALALAEERCPGELVVRCDLLLALGAELIRSGERDVAVQTLSRAAGLARELNDPDRLAAAALASSPGFFAVEAGAPDDFVIGLLREAIACRESDGSRLRALLLARLAMALAWRDEASQREALTIEAWRIASESGDPDLRLQVLLARWFAEWEPDRFEKRWAVADQLMAEGAVHNDREIVLLCRLFHVTCLLERGETSEFKRQVAIFEEAADSLRQPEALWYSALLRATLSLHLGRLAEADALSRRFAAAGEMVRDVNIFHSRTSHRVVLAWERGEFDEMIAAASEGCDAFPAMYGWHAARAWALACAGRVNEARRGIEFLVRDGVGAIPRRMDWSVTMATLAEACVLVGNRELAIDLFNELRCLRSRLIVVGLCVATWGCASRYLGRLARLAGDWEHAEELLRESVEIEARAEASAWAAWSMYELGSVLIENPRASHALKREGREWVRKARAEAERIGLEWLRTTIEHGGRPGN